MGKLKKMYRKLISKQDIKLVKKADSLMDGGDSGLAMNMVRSSVLIALIPLVYALSIMGTVWIFGEQGFAFYGLIVPIVFAPLVEEGFKRYALLKKYPFLYTAMFAAYEALLYIQMIMMGGFTFLYALSIRSKAFCLHMFTTTVQYHYHKKGKKEKNPNLSIWGFVIACLIHALWNLIASVG